AKKLTDPAALSLRLDDTLALIEHLLQSVRTLSLHLRPALLDEIGLVPALRAHVNTQARRAGLTVRFDADDLIQRLHPIVEIACFRVAQEALTNVIRHSHGKFIEIELHCPESELQLILRDDGIGFDAAAAKMR